MGCFMFNAKTQGSKGAREAGQKAVLQDDPLQLCALALIFGCLPPQLQSSQGSACLLGRLRALQRIVCKMTRQYVTTGSELYEHTL